MLPPKCDACDEIATHKAVYDGDVTQHTALVCSTHADYYEDRDYSVNELERSPKNG